MTLAPSERAQALTEKLRSELTIEHLEVVDQSHLHAGHAGAKDGKSHFRIVIQAEEFSGKSLLQKHRLVFQAAGDLMQTDIHALSIDIPSP